MLPSLGSLAPVSSVYAADPLACSKDHNWTGLNFGWTNIYNDKGQFLGWPRKLYMLNGDGEWASFGGKFVYCIANHDTGQPQKGSEAIGIKLLKVSDYKLYDGNERMRSYYKSEERDAVTKFTFCLAAAAAMNAYQGTELYDCLDYTSGTYLYALAQSMFIAIEGRFGGGIWITSMNKEAAYNVFCQALDGEFHLTPKYGALINSVVKDQINANKEKFFNDCWSAAEVMYNGMQDTSNGTVANTMIANKDSDAGLKYILNIPCEQDTWDNYYKKIKLTKESQNNWKFVSQTYDASKKLGIITFERAGSGSSDNLQFNFQEKGAITDLSKPVLAEFNFCSLDRDGKQTHENFQTLFGAVYAEPTFTVQAGPPKPDSGGPDPGDESEGGIELEIHRYKHSEEWQTTYNIDLIKNDSETGKPLADSKWDVLEYDTLGEWNDGSSQLGSTYLDHPVGEAGNIGTNYNWANDNGTQFTRWEEDEEDPCHNDLNVTGEDGYLYEANTGGNITSTKAHSDTYNYTYTKGYCTGHPKPTITPYEGEGPEVEEKNAELEELAEEAWQEQVDYCEKLAAEGGFFHTMEESITDTAKNEMIADRDKFFNDFISLTYDYSARELQARTGYILHDLHTDDIPIERTVIHSSEYLNLISGASGHSDDAEGLSLDDAVLSVSDSEMDDEEVTARRDSSENKKTVKKAAVNKKASEETVEEDAVTADETVKDETKAEPVKTENALVATNSNAEKTDTEEKVETTEKTEEKENTASETESNDTVSDTDADIGAEALDDEYDPVVGGDPIEDDETIGEDEDADVATPSEYTGVRDEVEREDKTLWNILKEGFGYLKERIVSFVSAVFSDDEECFESALAKLSENVPISWVINYSFSLDIPFLSLN